MIELMADNHSAAIEAWEKSIALEPTADAYTSGLEPCLASTALLHQSREKKEKTPLTIDLASAYVMSKPPQPSLAIKHLTWVSLHCLQRRSILTEARHSSLPQKTQKSHST